MRRALFETTMVMPYADGDVIDRLGFLSAVLGASCSAASGSPTLTVTVEHSDDPASGFAEVEDSRLLPVHNTVTLTQDVTSLLPIDLIGCKRYIKITPELTGTASCTYALVLGDNDQSPV